MRVGLLDGPDEYIFGNITGAVRLEDGSVVVADEQSHEVRKYDAGGRHLWTSGREGEGPGEYKGLLADCGAARERRSRRTTGSWTESPNSIRTVSVTDTRLLRRAAGPGPYGTPACSPRGDVVFTGWPDTESMELTAAMGARYRWEMSLSRERDDSVATLRSGIPGHRALPSW